MSVQLIWKRSYHHILTTMASFRPLGLPHIKFSNLCTQIETPSTTSPGGRVDIFINKCGLTNEEVTKVFEHRNMMSKSTTHEFEEVLELLNDCVVTTRAHIRMVVLCNPTLFSCCAERIRRSKLTFLSTIMRGKDISKLVCVNSWGLTVAEEKLKSVISLLQKLGIEGQELSELLEKQPRLLTCSEKKLMEPFKQAENIGFKKGSKRFAAALRSLLGVGKENFDRRLQCLINLGFSEKQVSTLVSRQSSILSLSDETLKRKVDFLVESAGLPLAELVKYPTLLGYSLEKRMIPGFRVWEALKSMQEQGVKREAFFKHCYFVRKTFLR